MNVSIGAKTDAGRRPNNEDQLAVVDVQRHRLRADSVLIIADGMGGRNFGERASSAAVETVQDTLTEMLSSAHTDAIPIGDALDSALRKANARVYELAGAGEDTQGMGTTCVAAVLAGDRLWVAHAGDSRAYLLRDGQLARLTDDHSYVAEQVRAGALSEEGARRSRFRNVITRAIGIEPTIAPDVAAFPLQAGDAVLLCTDGLSNVLEEEEIAQTLAQTPGAQAAAERLVQAAYKGGGRDNITAVVARVAAGERTLQMRAEDLAPAPKSGDGEAASEAGGEGTGAGTNKAAGRAARRGAGLGLLGAVFVTLVIAALLASTLFLARLLQRDGFVFQTAPPFAVKPPPPAPPAMPDPASLQYSPPALFYPVPVQGGLLARDASTGSLSVVTLTGQVVRLSADGRVISKFPAPDKTPAPDALPALAAEGNLHFAMSGHGDLYVADTAARDIVIYQPSGKPVAHLPANWLQRPAALAVSDDGTIYVIDNERLKVIRAARPAPPKGAL